MQIGANGCFDFLKRRDGIPVCVEMPHLAPRDNIPRFDGWERSADLTLAPAGESGRPWLEKIIMRGGGVPAAGGRTRPEHTTPEEDLPARQVTVRTQQVALFSNKMGNDSFTGKQ